MTAVAAAAMAQVGRVGGCAAGSLVIMESQLVRSGEKLRIISSPPSRDTSSTIVVRMNSSAGGCGAAGAGRAISGAVPGCE